ncbi:MAG TPA: polyprenyl synthetase family protein [Deltaproteobacteria bacterium]|nr:polyprenyl synthetase family protein [Deltaproteobacteria bacterium]HOM29661.1 polyprenyl synthetase family protein [Deltaproteobacteria bacterium]HPP81015.1 polyprenyl synthetase family protein [Deltaproteobacteria bacterium]
MEIASLLAAWKAEFDTFLEDYINRAMAGPGLSQACAYSLKAGGKRLRPVLAMMAAEAAGGRRRATLDAGLAIEMIHTFSLIHDDLPAIDDDDTRRGVPTCHRAFGEATAILAGDALIFQAFSVICTSAYPLEVKIDLCSAMAEACGADGLVKGEYEDVAAEGANPGIESIEGIYERKTAALFGLSMYAGSRVATDERDVVACLRRYGKHLGMAFQAMDDILDATSDAETLGKASRKDASKGKATLVRVMGVDASRAWAERQTALAVEALDGLGKTRTEALRELARWQLERVR